MVKNILDCTWRASEPIATAILCWASPCWGAGSCFKGITRAGVSPILPINRYCPSSNLFVGTAITLGPRAKRIPMAIDWTWRAGNNGKEAWNLQQQKNPQHLHVRISTQTSSNYQGKYASTRFSSWRSQSVCLLLYVSARSALLFCFSFPPKAEHCWGILS